MTLERVVARLAERVEQRYYGKYRGFVVDNKDPAQLGRLRLRVPSVLGTDVVTGWASACVPFGGAADQGFLFIPDPGAGVWVEFEEGDLEFPDLGRHLLEQAGRRDRASQTERPRRGGTVPAAGPAHLQDHQDGQGTHLAVRGR